MRLFLALLLALAAGAQTLPNAAPFAYNSSPQFFDTLGRPLAGGKVCTYQAGTTTPQATFTDATAGTPNTNPIVLNGGGFPTSMSGSVVGIFGTGTNLYKLVVRTAGSDGTCNTGTVITTYDQIGDVGLFFATAVKNAGTATTITYTPPQTGGTSQTVNAKLNQIISVLDFGAKCDNATDDTTAIANAISAAQSTSLDLWVDGNAPCITQGQTISAPVQMRGPGTLKRKTGITAALLTITGNNVLIDGITLDGNNQGTNGGTVVFANGPTGFTLTRATIANNVGGEEGVQCKACINGLLQGNTLITSIVGPGIDVINGSARVRVVGNIVNHASSSNGTLVGAALGAHTSSGTLNDIVFMGNTVISAVGWCIEAASQGGGTVSQITIENNTCTINNSTGNVACTAGAGTIKPCGGFSFSVVQDSVMNGNTLNATGQTLDVASAQALQCRRCTITSNTLDGAATDGTVNGSRGLLLQCNGCNVSNNVINGWGPLAGVNGIDFTMVSGFEQVDQNVVANNKVIFPTTAATLAGISFTCSLATGSHSMSFESITGNILDGVTGANTTGINLNQTNGSCGITGAIVSNNLMTGLNQGLNFATALLSTVTENNFSATVTTPFSCTTCTYNTVVGTASSSASSATHFATLAACSASTAGGMAPVNDSTTATWGATIAGGGANVVLAYCDGTNWTVFAK